MYIVDLDQIRGLVAERNQLAEEVSRLRGQRDQLWWALASVIVFAERRGGGLFISAERSAEAEQALRQYAPEEPEEVE